MSSTENGLVEIEFQTKQVHQIFLEQAIYF